MRGSVRQKIAEEQVLEISFVDYCDRAAAIKWDKPDNRLGWESIREQLSGLFEA